jgi:hypothetical protein
MGDLIASERQKISKSTIWVYYTIYYGLSRGVITNDLWEPIIRKCTSY